ncbi:MAG: tRNA (adenosine(37)-N6)-dimethylallyltransferase MiaA [Stellaceae bacterium]
MASPGAISIVIIAGPTASGKSALALHVAEQFGGTIINADSQQVYRDLAVLSARPGTAALTRAPHRLYGAIDAAEGCSAGRWRRLALEAIAEARREQRLPILVGGTGLYLEALLDGLAELPPIPPAARSEAQALHDKLGAAGFHAALAALDPQSAERLAPSDRQRLTRAYEVVRATGVPLSEWRRRQAPLAGLRAAAIVLLPPRDALYRACDERVLDMIAGGAEAEVEALMSRRLAPSLPAMKAVGVRELVAFLEGQVSHAQAVAAMQQATRNYAKRQYAWFRRRLPESNSLQKMVAETQFSESLLPEFFAFIRAFLLTHSL